MTDLSRTSAAQAERPWPTREDLERELYWYLETYRDWITGARVDPNGEMIIDHLMLVLNALPEIREWVDGTIVIHTGRMNDRLALTRYQRLVNLLYRAMRNDPHTFAARLAWTLAIREHGVMAGGNRVIDIRGQLPSSGQIGVRELAGMVYEAAVCRDAFKR